MQASAKTHQSVLTHALLDTLTQSPPVRTPRVATASPINTEIRSPYIAEQLSCHFPIPIRGFAYFLVKPTYVRWGRKTDYTFVLINL